jgi:hypothetical protein
VWDGNCSEILEGTQVPHVMYVLQQQRVTRNKGIVYSTPAFLKINDKFVVFGVVLFMYFLHPLTLFICDHDPTFCAYMFKEVCYPGCHLKCVTIFSNSTNGISARTL